MWCDIASAPKDGSKVWVRQLWQGRTAFEGWAVWGRRDPAFAHVRADACDRVLAGSEALPERWLKPDRDYYFPEPTQWRPEGEP